jgi:hypothetical protein
MGLTSSSKGQRPAIFVASISHSVFKGQRPAIFVASISHSVFKGQRPAIFVASISHSVFKGQRPAIFVARRPYKYYGALPLFKPQLMGAFAPQFNPIS